MKEFVIDVYIVIKINDEIFEMWLPVISLTFVDFSWLFLNGKLCQSWIEIIDVPRFTRHVLKTHWKRINSQWKWNIQSPLLPWWSWWDSFAFYSTSLTFGPWPRDFSNLTFHDERRKEASSDKQTFWIKG